MGDRTGFTCTFSVYEDHVVFQGLMLHGIWGKTVQ